MNVLKHILSEIGWWIFIRPGLYLAKSFDAATTLGVFGWVFGWAVGIIVAGVFVLYPLLS